MSVCKDSARLHKKVTGFTLIELLLVVAIIAVISVVVVFALNPAEVLRQTRDSTRISDISTLRSSVALYLATVTALNLASSSGTYGKCYTTVATGSCGFGFLSSYLTVSSTNNTRVDSSGWLPVDFTQISSGPPISSLPLDPVNNASYFYAYAATTTNTSFKFVATGMESVKYRLNGARDVVSHDGGNFQNAYEAGTMMSL